jgi:hypothetical protein
MPTDLVADRAQSCETGVKKCGREVWGCRSHHTSAFRITSVSSAFAKCRKSRSPAFS